jgi:hypothetical protein
VSRRCIGDYHDTATEPRDINQIRCGGDIDDLKHVLTTSYDERLERPMELINQAVLHQSDIEPTTLELDEVSTGLPL